MLSMSPTGVTISATPVDSEVVTAWEGQASLVLLDLSLSNRRRWLAEVHQAGLAAPPRAPVVPVDPLLRLRGLKLMKIVSTRRLSGVSNDYATTVQPCVLMTGIEINYTQ